MRMIVISDTHIPVRAREIPDVVKERAREMDLIIHAGDFEVPDVLTELREMGEVRAVHGNMDRHELKEKLPEKEVFEIEGHRIGLTHGSGAPSGLEQRVRELFGDVDVIVYGHSHRPRNEVIDNILFFNPGSPTDRIFAPYNSFGILTVGKEIRGEIVRI